MGRNIKIKLDDTQRAELEDGYRTGTTHTFRQHCQIVLLKADGRRSKDVAAILGCCERVVNLWLHKYKADGIAGLAIKPGAGRRSILSPEADAAAVRAAVQQHRQRISRAKAELETELGKRFSEKTLQRFLKNLVADTNA